MRNPWLDIPLEDYEGHMGSPGVAQADMLANVLSRLLVRYAPASAALIGCAGGHGFDRISPEVTRRVIGVDLNPSYVQTAAARFRGRFADLELLAGDIGSERVRFDPVDFICAALVLEFVDPARVVSKLAQFLNPGGHLATVVQLASSSISNVTPSAYASLAILEAHMKLVDPADLRRWAEASGLREVFCEEIMSPAGKHFQLQVFEG